MMMDRGGGTLPDVNSSRHGEEHHLNSPDSGKKRKLQCEQLGLPMSKHKFRERCSGPAQGFPDPSHLETVEITEENSSFCRINLKPDDGPDPSEDDSNSIPGDAEVQTEMPSENSSLACGASTSSGRRHADSDFRSKLYSLDSRIIQIADPRERYSDLEDEIQVEPEFEDPSEQLPPLGAFGEYIEECPDAAIEEFMLYSNDVAPNAFAHSSGRWGFKQDARLGSRKPTIDQEFEQYFSMLML